MDTEKAENLGCQEEELIEVFKKQILSLVEFAVPHWGPMITQAESKNLERLLKTALHIVYGQDYISFENARNRAQIKTLAERRKDIIFRFSRSVERSPKFSSWFAKEEKPVVKLRSRNIQQYKQVQCRTKRFEHSPLPILTYAASWHPPKVYVAPDVN